MRMLTEDQKDILMPLLREGYVICGPEQIVIQGGEGSSSGLGSERVENTQLPPALINKNVVTFGV